MEKAALASYVNVARMVYERPWAILPQTLAVIEEVVRLRVEGFRFTEDELAERVGAVDRRAVVSEFIGSPEHCSSHGPRLIAPTIHEGVWAAVGPTPAGTPGALAVINLMGVLVPRADMFTQMSGGTSLENFQARFKAALNDPDVAGILLNVDSPGGSVYLTPETADMVYAARDQKPVVALANPMAASGAYYIASQAEEFYMTPSGEVGSIGVLMAHDDISAMAEKAGVKRTYISTPQYKVEGNPYEPLSEKTIAYLQSEVEDVYGEFVAAVARGRNVLPNFVREGMGQGRMLRASDAEDAAMVDGTATFDQAVVRLAQMTRGARGWQAMADFRRAVLYGSLRLDEPTATDEIPAPQVADAGEAGGTAAKRARLRGRRIES